MRIVDEASVILLKLDPRREDLDLGLQMAIASQHAIMMEVRCPFCGSEVGVPCVYFDSGEQRVVPHNMRRSQWGRMMSVPINEDETC